MAIESVLNQNFDSFELILVVDGATDGSSEICDEIALKDARVVVVHQKNMGVSVARNTGLDVARGEYIAFCDHDDEYSPGILSEHYKVAKQSDADVVCFPVKYSYMQNGCEYEKMLSVPTKGYEREAYFEIVRDLKIDKPTLFGYVWNHLYKKSSIQNIRFDPLFKHGNEDCAFNMEVLSTIAGLFVFNEGPFYHHINRENSLGKVHHKLLDESFSKEFLHFFACEKKFMDVFFNTSLENRASKRCDLVDNLRMLHYRCEFKTTKELKPFRDCDYIRLYPIKLHVKEKILLWSFLNSYPIFDFLCKFGWCSTEYGKIRIVLMNEISDFFKTPLSGFFLNLYQSKRGRWLFDLCNFGVKVITLPFRLFK